MKLCSYITARDTDRSLYNYFTGTDLGFFSGEGAPFREIVTDW